MNLPIWQCDADEKTGLDALKAFCESYWDEPRKASPIAGDGTFKLVDGCATYRLALVIGRPSVYSVTKVLV